MGFAYAAATMVAQNLGANRPDRARRAAWTACGLAAALTTTIGVLMFSMPTLISRAFTTDPEVIEIAASYLVIVAISELFMALEIVLEGAFGGAGDTLPPLIVAGPLSIARVPMAYWLALGLGWGIDGVWWAISLSTVAKGALMGVWYLRRSRQKTVVSRQ
jgi:Na+-driven multidrug efflux pump